MPQMMPMSWLILFFVFSLTLIMFTTMNYYTTIQKMMITPKKNNYKNTLNWKW
uniref:ATP synthase complex subunit 8 n=1 Tax=Marginitermes hubbardi TaxID=2942694 RepID=A0A8X8M2X9_9NEOP|nr:ATP synthase F0 subunit 8 [Marginitermes hubbardi]